MHKILAFILTLITAPILGGVYGIVHDQITYTLSKEYYTKFKFIQFGLDKDYWALGHNIGTEQQPEIKLVQPRLSVSIIGFLATWWVGLIAGIVLGIMGLGHKTVKQMLQVTAQSFLIVILIAFLVAFIGFIYGYGKTFLVDDYPNYFPQNLICKNCFMIVGSTHNFSYVGGVIGLMISMIYNIKRKYSS